MLVVILLVAVLAAQAVAGLVVWIRRAASSERIIGAPAGEPVQVFAGDVMSRYVLTSGDARPVTPASFSAPASFSYVAASCAMIGP